MTLEKTASLAILIDNNNFIGNNAEIKREGLTSCPSIIKSIPHGSGGGGLLKRIDAFV